MWPHRQFASVRRRPHFQHWMLSRHARLGRGRDPIPHSLFLKYPAMTKTTCGSDACVIPRSQFGLASHRVHWWRGYHTTVGLEAYRSDERYAVWLHTHRRLTADNPLYAADTRWFWTCVALSCVLTLSLWMSLGLLVPAATFALAAGVLLTYREQRRRNGAIAEQLKVAA